MKIGIYVLPLLLMICSCQKEEPVPEGEILAESSSNFRCESNQISDLAQAQKAIIGTWELKAIDHGWFGFSRTVPIEEVSITDTDMTYLRYKQENSVAIYEIIESTFSGNNVLALKFSPNNAEPTLTLCEDIMIIDYCSACDGTAYYYRRVK